MILKMIWIFIYRFVVIIVFIVMFINIYYLFKTYNYINIYFLNSKYFSYILMSSPILESILQIVKTLLKRANSNERRITEL
jgi:hypothetical protein